MKTIRDLVNDGEFIVETVCGPYICKWGWVGKQPAVIFVKPYNPPAGATAPFSPAPTSPKNLDAINPISYHQPPADVRGVFVEQGGIPL